MRRLGGAGYLVGDSSYDSNPLHKTASGRHHQVVAPPKKKGRGLGHRRHEPGRLRSRDLLAGAFGRALYATRSALERWFSRLEGIGLGRLPGAPAELRKSSPLQSATKLARGLKVAMFITS